jgi:hypothetical protein
MSVFAITREAGQGWTKGKGAFEQPGVNDHAGFMTALATEGIVLFAGPLAGPSTTASECCSSQTPLTKPESAGASPTTPGHAHGNL